MRDGEIGYRLIALVVLVACAAPVYADGPPSVQGTWKGSISWSSGRAGMTVVVESVGTGWAGSIQVPIWGDSSWALGEVTVSANRILFRVAGPGDQNGTFEGQYTGKQIVGTYTWSDRVYGFAVERGDVPESNYPRFTQIIGGTRPYAVDEVAIPNGDIRIAGLLSLPNGKGGHPAVLLLGGDHYNFMMPISNPQIPGDPTIAPDGLWLISDQLARQGVAVLRVNPRGVGGSSGEFEASTVSDLVNDATSCIEFLRRHSGVDGKSIGVVGFGDGGLIAPQAVNIATRIQCLALLSAPALPDPEVYGLSARRQLKLRFDLETKRIRAIDERNNIRGILIEQIDGEERVLALAKGGYAPERIREMLTKELNMPAPRVKKLFGSFIDSSCTAHRRSCLQYDPRVALRKLDVPVLVIAGGLDVRVCAEENVPEMRRALQEHCHDLTVEVYPELTHSLLKPRVHDFTHIVYELDPAQDTIIDPEVVRKLSDWILHRLSVTGPR